MAPKIKDRDNARPKLNFNYSPPPEGPRPMREGTARHALVVAMRKGGVTLADVQAMFPQLNDEQVVYRIRDLRFTGRHGLKMVNGRIFLDE